MKLYTHSGSCSMSDHIALEWTGTQYDVQVVDDAQMKSPAYLKLNPAGQVPVLDDDGMVLTQNAAILNYIADRFPDAKLGGDGTPQGRAEVNRWLSFVNSDVHPTFHPLFGSTEYLQNAAVIEQTKEHARQKLRKQFERIDAQLADKQYLVGQRSIADAYAFVVTQWAKQWGVDLSRLDNLAAFDARMAADAGVQAALKAEGFSYSAATDRP